MKVNYLEFIDNIKIYYVNNDRKNHVVIPEGCIFNLEKGWPLNNLTISYKTSKMTYKQWESRWAKRRI